MKEEIIIAGFGGQGVLSMGKILAYSGLMEGKEVTWMRPTDRNSVAVRQTYRNRERRENLLAHPEQV